MPKRNGKQYTPEERASLVKEVRAAMKAGVTQDQACKDAGISTGSFFHWTNRRPSYAKKTKMIKRAIVVGERPEPRTTIVDEEDIDGAETTGGFVRALVLTGTPADVGHALSHLY